MNENIYCRRSFIFQIIAASCAPMFLKGAGRIWVPSRTIYVFNPDWLNYQIQSVMMGEPINDLPSKIATDYLIEYDHQNAMDIISPDDRYYPVLPMLIEKESFS